MVTTTERKDLDARHEQIGRWLLSHSICCGGVAKAARTHDHAEARRTDARRVTATPSSYAAMLANASVLNHAGYTQSGTPAQQTAWFAACDQLIDWRTRHGLPVDMPAPFAMAALLADHAEALEYDRETQPLTPHQIRVAKSSMVDVFTPNGIRVVIDRGGATYCHVSGVGIYRRRVPTHILRASALLQEIAQAEVLRRAK